MFEAGPALCQLVDIWRLEVVRPVAAHAANAKVVRKNEDDVRLLRIGTGGCRRLRRRKSKSNEKERGRFHVDDVGGIKSPAGSAATCADPLRKEHPPQEKVAAARSFALPESAGGILDGGFVAGDWNLFADQVLFHEEQIAQERQRDTRHQPGQRWMPLPGWAQLV